MPSKFRLRFLFKKRFLIKNLATLFQKIHLKPNHITFLMLITSIISCTLLILNNNLIVFGILVLIVTILDGVDGYLARMSNQTTLFGGFLDSTFDRLSEGFIIIGLYFGIKDSFIFGMILYRIFLIMILIFSILISYMRARIEIEIPHNKYDFDIGLFARSERLFMIFLVSIIPFREFFTYGLIFLAIGVVLTFFYRGIKYLKILGKE